MGNDSDEAIVRRVIDGKVQAYAMLVERYERPVYNLMYRYCRCEHEAADLSQDVFLRAYERLSSFDGSRKFFPWLYTLALNRARDWQRTSIRKRQGLAELRWEIPAAENGSRQEEYMLGREKISSMFGALDTLSDETREMVLLRYQQEMPIRELAGIFQLSESAVKMRITRALERLKSELTGGRNDG